MDVGCTTGLRLNYWLRLWAPTQSMWAERDRSSGQAREKNDGAGAERGAGWSRNGNGAVSGGLNWPLKFRSKWCYSNFVMLYNLLYPMSKINYQLTGILIPVGPRPNRSVFNSFCFRIPNFDVFVWTASILRQHTSVIISGTRIGDQILHDTFSPFRYQCVGYKMFTFTAVIS